MLAYQPLHAQLKESIKSAIQNGAYSAGVRLPSQRELCLQYKMSHMTVRRAINELVSEGFIITIPGRGLFVKGKNVTYPLENFKGFNTLTREGGQVPSSVVLEARLISATAPLARDLLIPTNSEVVYLHRVRFIDGRPVMIQQSWLPHEFCPEILNNDFSSASLFEVLADDYGIKVVEGHQTIRARLATPEERRQLKLPNPSAVLTVDALEYSQLQRPVEFSISVFNPQVHPLRQTNRAG
jgi:GntR family transcriptional regulator